MIILTLKFDVLVHIYHSSLNIIDLNSMSIQVSYTKSTIKTSGNIVFFVDEKFNSKSIKKYTTL